MEEDQIAEFYLTHEEYVKLQKLMPLGYSIAVSNKKSSARNKNRNFLINENIGKRRSNVSLEEPEVRVSRVLLGELSRKGQKIVNNLKKNKISYPFHYPVDTVTLNIPDYNDIIKQPMDLSTIEKNLKESYYKNNEELDSDFRKIWTNAKLYNPEGSDIHKYADELEKLYNNLFNEIFYEDSNSLNLNRNNKNRKSEDFRKTKNNNINLDKPLSYQEKKNLSQMIRSLPTEDLLGVWEIISDGMDQMYEQEVIEIDIDKLSSKKARELEKYVKTKVGTFNKHKKILTQPVKFAEDKDPIENNGVNQINDMVEDDNSNHSSFLLNFDSDSN